MSAAPTAGGDRRETAPRDWLVVRLPRPSDPDVAALAVEVLLGHTRGVEERGGMLVAYLVADDLGHAGDPSDEDRAPTALDEIRRSLESLLGEPPALRTTRQPHAAWERRWRAGLAPRRIGERLVVSPSWCDPHLESGELLVVVDPGMAFGTAEHATTRGCLRLLERCVEPGRRIVDVGTGSGILSIAAARLGAEGIVALESDPWACRAARENVAANGVDDRVRIREAVVTPQLLAEIGPFDGAVANLERGLILPLLPGLREALVAGGWLVLSGILGHEAEDVVAAVRAEGFEPREHDAEGEWWSGAFVTTGEGGRPGSGPGRGP